MSGVVIQCPHCTWEKHSQIASIARTALTKHLTTCKGVRR